MTVYRPIQPQPPDAWGIAMLVDEPKPSDGTRCVYNAMAVSPPDSDEGPTFLTSRWRRGDLITGVPDIGTAKVESVAAEFANETWCWVYDLQPAEAGE